MSFTTAIDKVFEKKEPAWGFWLTFPSAAVAKVILRSAATSPSGPFSWVLIDAEHGLISDKDYYELVNAVASEGATPIIRVPWSEEWLIKRALDSGTHGVLTPMCHTPEDAKRIVQYSKYPPGGSRGYGPMYALHSYANLPADKYDDGADKGLLVSVQIESRQGVENVEEIAKIEGLDILLIGPFDLAKHIGVVRGGEEHEAAIQRTLEAAKAAGKKAAIFCSNGAQAKERAAQGFDMISVITDTGVIGEGMIRELSTARGIGAAGKERSGY